MHVRAGHILPLQVSPSVLPPRWQPDPVRARPSCGCSARPGDTAGGLQCLILHPPCPQEPAFNTAESRKKGMALVVALTPDGFARGELFWDDGESWQSFEKGDYTETLFLASHVSVAGGLVGGVWARLCSHLQLLSPGVHAVLGSPLPCCCKHPAWRNNQNEPRPRRNRGPCGLLLACLGHGAVAGAWRSPGAWWHRVTVPAVPTGRRAQPDPADSRPP